VLAVGSCSVLIILVFIAYRLKIHNETQYYTPNIPFISISAGLRDLRGLRKSRKPRKPAEVEALMNTILSNQPLNNELFDSVAF